MILSLARLSLAVLCTATVALVGCGEDEPALNPVPNPTAVDGALRQSVVDAYAANTYQGYLDSLNAAKQLQSAIATFVASPSADTLDAAKSAWRSSRIPYGETEVHRFYGGPIDDDDGPEGQINAWPLDENFIDYTTESPNGGIIAEVATPIDVALLKSRNGKGGEANVATGYHAIEFLLWGQDIGDPLARTAGARSFTDYTSAPNADRRKAYLQAAADLLVEDLQSVVDAWTEGQGYSATFRSDPSAAVSKMVMGMGSLALAELSGERMVVAYKNRSVEDEHSCFSDTTNADLLGNFLGIQNVYLGRWGSRDLPGLDELVAPLNADLDLRTKADMAAAESALRAMTAPFDAAIMSPDGAPDRQKVLSAILAIQKVGADVQEIASALGVAVEFEEPSEAL